MRVLVAVTLLQVTGCGTFMKDVPPTFASIAAPITRVEPSPDKATLLIVNPLGTYDLGRQAATLVRDGLEPIAQVVPRSFAVAQIPPGNQTLVVGIPELGSADQCAWHLRQEFKSGQIYVINMGALDNTQPTSMLSGKHAVNAGVVMDLGRMLSRLTYFQADSAQGSREIEAQRDYWNTCYASATNGKSWLVVKPAPALPGPLDIPSPP
jgi:hypothetical protein